MSKMFLMFLFLFNFSLAAILDEAFKDVEISGTMQYRYDTKREKSFDKKSKTHKSKTQTQITIN